MKGLKFRRLSLEQLGECTALYLSVFNSEPWNDAWTPETASKRLEVCLLTPDALCLGAYQRGEIRALALGNCEQWFTGQHFYLKEMCVETKKQRSGIGHALMDELRRTLREQRVERIYLLTSRESSAEAFYSKLGFYRSDKMGLYALPLEDV